MVVQHETPMTERTATMQKMLHPWGLTEQWIEFISEMDDVHEQQARRQGEPYIRHTDDELRAVAALVADYGIAPGMTLDDVTADDRALTLGGVG